MTPFMEDPFANISHKLFIARFLMSIIKTYKIYQHSLFKTQQKAEVDQNTHTFMTINMLADNSTIKT